MKPKQTGLNAAMCMLMLFSFACIFAQDKTQVVRVAKLRIDAAQLESYHAALKEEIETSVRVEPGVLTLYAVSDKAHPTEITVFEIYADAAAFRAHLETPHFKKYKTTTKDMVKSLQLLETVPITLATKTPKKEEQLNAADKTHSGDGSKPTELYGEIVAQDSIFFRAFNSCDTLTYRKYLTNDFEFYHDLGGLHYLDEEMQSMREMCQKNSHIRRELLKNILEVHQLGNFGALEIGVHRFYHTNPGQSEHESGTYKFVHVWQKKDNAWRISRVISYDHGKMNNN